MNTGSTRITSLQNPLVKNLVKLRRRSHRDRQSLFVIEESLVIRRALAAGYPLQTVCFCPELLAASSGRSSDDGAPPSAQAVDDTLLAELRAYGAAQKARNDEAGELDFVELSPPVFTKISYRDRPEGILVVAPQETLTLAQLPQRPQGLYVALVSVEKPGNLGAVLRVADGAGADAVLLCGSGTDLFNPNVLRASRGACFSVPTVQADAPAVAAFLSERAIGSVATSPTATTTFTDLDLTAPTAFIVGAEHAGLDGFWLESADACVRIPMHGTGDSLNVATSAAVLLYEAMRQRG